MATLMAVVMGTDTAAESVMEMVVLMDTKQPILNIPYMYLLCQATIWQRNSNGYGYGYGDGDGYGYGDGNGYGYGYGYGDGYGNGYGYGYGYSYEEFYA